MCAMARGLLPLTVVVLCILSSLEAVLAHYTATWAVHVPGGKGAADEVAWDHGFVNLGEVSFLFNFGNKNRHIGATYKKRII